MQDAIDCLHVVFQHLMVAFFSLCFCGLAGGAAPGGGEEARTPRGSMAIVDGSASRHPVADLRKGRIGAP